jgi:hypothetical protein
MGVDNCTDLYVTLKVFGFLLHWQRIWSITLLYSVEIIFKWLM